MSLGSTLKMKRKQLSLKLREVESRTGISNSYLSQLENDKISSPSAKMLNKLSNFYNISLESLCAGMIVPGSEDWQDLAFYESFLTRPEKEKLLNFAKFIIYERTQ